MRITMSMIQQNYKNNLSTSKNMYNKYSLRATTTRSFDKPSDDPLAASKSYDLQWNINMNDAHQSNISSIQSAEETADSTLMSVYSSLKAASTSYIASITSTMSQDDRNTYAGKLLSLRDSLVTDMNLKSGSQYLFAGSASDSTPFKVDGDGNLLYRGINVNTGENTNGASETIISGDKKIQINFGKSIGKKLNGYKIAVNVDSGASNNTVSASGKTISITMKKDAAKSDLQDLLQGADFETALSGAGIENITSDDLQGITISGLPDSSSDKLDASYSDESGNGITDKVSLDDLANETVYVDIGLGITKDGNGGIDSQSAYNTALPGISFLGYGKSNNGVDENLYSLLGDMADTLKDTSLKGQSLMDKIDPYINNFNDSLDNFRSQQSSLGTRMDSLSSTSTYLKNLSSDLVTEESSVASVSPYEAITDFSQQVYYYTAALQVGSKLIQPTLIDYMS